MFLRAAVVTLSSASRIHPLGCLALRGKPLTHVIKESSESNLPKVRSHR